jgi:hypothetical protein
MIDVARLYLSQRVWQIYRDYEFHLLDLAAMLPDWLASYVGTL